MPLRPSFPPEYRAALMKSILAAKAKGADVSLGNKLCLKDRSGQIIFEDDPDESHGYYPGDARTDCERFLSYGFRFFTFGELSKGNASGDGDCSDVKWKYGAEYDVIGNGFYREDYGFEITLELLCPGLGSGAKTKLERTRHFESWPSSEDFAKLRSDIDDLIKDWHLLNTYLAYVIDQKIPHEVGASHIAAENFEIRVRDGGLWFRSVSCQGDWDETTIDAYERVTRNFSDWLKPKLKPVDEMPPMESDIELM